MIGARETAISFPCGDNTLFGIIHHAEADEDCGVLIVVGGPQYRIGSHRQFVLLARDLAAAGVPAMRFDVTGMGDSSGDFPGFENIEHDISAAIDAFRGVCPGLDRIVLWGLCDGASAILFYAHRDPRVVGAVLANPWVRTESGLAQTRLRHYYTGQLARVDFWRRLVSGRVPLGPALGAFMQTLGKAVFRRRRRGAHGASTPRAALPLPDRMALGLQAFSGPVLLTLSGQDLTAQEFVEATRSSPLWQALLADARVTRETLPGSDHTFSRRDDRNKLAKRTCEWVRARFLEGDAAASLTR